MKPKKTNQPRKSGQSRLGSKPPTGPADSDKDLIRRLKWLDGRGEKYRAKLLRRIKERLPELEELLRKVEDHWGLEDGVYRFYHQSFKVYRLQIFTEEITQVLQELLPDQPLNASYRKIVAEGTGQVFDASHNAAWAKHTRPIVEACFHACFFLKMACKYGRQMDELPSVLPSGWALVLYLFDLRY